MSITHLAALPSSPPTGGNDLDLGWPLLIISSVVIAVITAALARDIVTGPNPNQAARTLVITVVALIPTTVLAIWVIGDISGLIALIVPPTVYVVAAFAGAVSGVAHNIRHHGVPLTTLAALPTDPDTQR